MREHSVSILLIIAMAMLGLLSPESIQADGGGPNVLFIFDASGSMYQKIDGETKLKTGKEALSTLVGDFPKGSNVGLEIYGHRVRSNEKESCSDIEVAVPVKGLDPELIREKLDSLDAKGKTPIAASIEMGADLFRGLNGKKTIILISDGEETCGGDPVGAAKKIRAEFGVDVVIHVVGFNVGGEEKKQLSDIAEAGGGRYYSADNSEELKQSLTKIKDELGAPERETAKATDIFFEDTFGKNFLGPDWVVVNEEEDYIVLDDGVLIITRSYRNITDKDGNEKELYPNTLKLDKPLPENFEITAEWEVDFQTGKFWGQEISLKLISDNGNSLQAGVRYGDFGSAGFSFYFGRFITKWTKGKKNEIVNRGDTVGKNLGLQKVQVRLVKKKFDYVAYTRKTGEEWKEAGRQKLLKLPEPRLQLMQYNWGGPEVEARIKHITISEVK